MIAIVSIPIGVATALYLEELSRKGKIAKIVEVNIANLAGCPLNSLRHYRAGNFCSGTGFERSLVSGALTMSLLILPVIIIASREAIKTVPMSIRHAAYALGATKLQTAWAHVLPASFPGILTGVILALSKSDRRNRAV